MDSQAQDTLGPGLKNVALHELEPIAGVDKSGTVTQVEYPASPVRLLQRPESPKEEVEFSYTRPEKYLNGNHTTVSNFKQKITPQPAKLEQIDVVAKPIYNETATLQSSCQVAPTEPVQDQILKTRQNMESKSSDELEFTESLLPNIQAPRSLAGNSCQRQVTLVEPTYVNQYQHGSKSSSTNAVSIVGVSSSDKLCDIKSQYSEQAISSGHGSLLKASHLCNPTNTSSSEAAPQENYIKNEVVSSLFINEGCENSLRLCREPSLKPAASISKSKIYLPFKDTPIIIPENCLRIKPQIEANREISGQQNPAENNIAPCVALNMSCYSNSASDSNISDTTDAIILKKLSKSISAPKRTDSRQESVYSEKQRNTNLHDENEQPTQSLCFKNSLKQTILPKHSHLNYSRIIADPEVQFSGRKNAKSQYEASESAENALNSDINNDSLFFHEPCKNQSLNDLAASQQFPDMLCSGVNPPSNLSPRPGPRHGNHGKPLVRPLHSDELRTRDISDTGTLHQTCRTKVIKSSEGQTRASCGQTSLPWAGTVLKPGKLVLAGYQQFLATGAKFEEILEDYENQKDIINIQKNEIEKLQEVAKGSTKKIQRLEFESLSLNQKVRRFHEISIKYRKHINDVIVAQKFVKAEGIEISKRVTEVQKQVQEGAIYEAREDIRKYQGQFQLATKKWEMVREEFEVLLTTNKKLGSSNIELVEANKKISHELEKVKKELQKITVQHEAEKIFLTSSIQKVKEQDEENQSRRMKREDKYESIVVQNQNLLLENNHLRQEVNCTTEKIHTIEEKNNGILKQIENEKSISGILEKELEQQKSYYRDLLALVKNIPVAVAVKLMGDDGFLEKLTSIENLTQEKIDHAISIFNDLKTSTSDVPASLVRLIEDLFTKLETCLQKQYDENGSTENATIKLLQDLKDSLEHMQLERETEACLNMRLSMLSEENKNLVKDKNSLNHELECAATKQKELKMSLITCEDLLVTKSNELTVALVSPRNDRRLEAKVHDLETENSTLAAQLEEKKQELYKSKQEWNLVQEKSRFKEKEFSELERKLLGAQEMISRFRAEKEQYMTTKDLDNKQYCQDLMRKAEFSRETLKLKLETEVKNLEQKNKEKDTELVSAKNSMRILQESADTQGFAAEKLQTELELYKDQLEQLNSQIKKLEDRNLEIEHSEHMKASLKSALSEISELKTLFEAVQRSNKDTTELAAKSQQAMEQHLHSLDVSQKGKESLETENAILREIVVTLQSQKQNQVDNDMRSTHETTKIMATLSMAPPARIPTNQSVRSSPSNLIGMNARDSPQNKIALNVELETPEHALRSAMNQVSTGATSQNDRESHMRVTMPDSSVMETGRVQGEEEIGDGSHHVELPIPGTSNYIERPVSAKNYPLRAADRKRSWLGSDNGMQVEWNDVKSLKLDLATQNPHSTLISNSSVPEESESSKIPTAETLSQHVTRSWKSSSSLTDYESLIEDLQSVNDRDTLGHEYEKTRNLKNHGSHKFISVSPKNLSKRGMHPSPAFRIQSSSSSIATTSEYRLLESEEEPRPKRQKKKFGAPPPVMEESKRRRSGISQPAKSSLKRTEQYKGFDALTGNESVSFLNGKSASKNHATSLNNGSNTKQQRTEPGPRAFRGVVGGKGAGSHDKQQHHAENSWDTQQSPTIQVSRRRGLSSTSPKRTSSEKLVFSMPLKQAVPDSNEDQNFQDAT